MLNSKIHYPIEVGAIAFMQGVRGMTLMRKHDNDDWEIDEWQMADKIYDVNLLKPRGKSEFTVRVVNTKTHESFVHIKCVRTKNNMYQWENFHPIYTNNK